MVKSRLLGAVGIVAIVGRIAGVLAAQTPAKPRAFDVASVKPHSASDARGQQLQFLPGGRLVIRNMPLGLIVARAYDVPIPLASSRISGPATWPRAQGERYDIEASGAIPPGASPKAQDDTMRQMLRGLLADRFKLQVHRGPAEQPGYALVVAKGGPKVQKSKTQENECGDAALRPEERCHLFSGGQGRGLHGAAVSIADVALFVQNFTVLPMVDKTGLMDLYNIQTDGWAPMQPSTTAPDTAPVSQTLFDVFDRLGLRMESQRVVVDMLVIDYVEAPTPD